MRRCLKQCGRTSRRISVSPSMARRASAWSRRRARMPRRPLQSLRRSPPTARPSGRQRPQHCTRRSTPWRVRILRVSTGSTEFPRPLDNIESVFPYSKFVAEACARDPELLSSPNAAPDLRAACEALLAGEPDESIFMDGLRRLRRRELVRIAWLDLACGASLEEVLRDLSALADAAIATALAFASR